MIHIIIGEVKAFERRKSSYVPNSIWEGDEDFIIGGGLTGVHEEASPTNSRLFSPAPNPSNGSFDITFDLEKKESLQFDLYTISGELITTISKAKEWGTGQHTIASDNLDLKTGNYIIKMCGG